MFRNVMLCFLTMRLILLVLRTLINSIHPVRKLLLLWIFLDVSTNYQATGHGLRIYLIRVTRWVLSRTISIMACTMVTHFITSQPSSSTTLLGNWNLSLYKQVRSVTKRALDKVIYLTTRSEHIYFVCKRHGKCYAAWPVTRVRCSKSYFLRLPLLAIIFEDSVAAPSYMI